MLKLKKAFVKNSGARITLKISANLRFGLYAQLKDHVVNCGYKCLLQSILNFNSPTEVNQYVKYEGIKVIIGIHAFRAGKLLEGCCIPFVIIFGGTDLNEHYRNKDRLAIMTKCVMEARLLVAFTDAMKSKAIYLWPETETKIVLQPQAVVCQPSEFSFLQYLRVNFGSQHSIVNNNMINHSLRLSEPFLGIIFSDLVIFLLVSGLRPVKDPLYLIETISEWHSSNDRIYLIVIGPELDEEYANICKNVMERTPGILYVSPVAHEDILAAIKNSFAVVNTSRSEGMASVILEAMSLGTPVIARQNEGNCAVLDHRETGLIFNSPVEFESLARELLSSEDLRNHIVENAKRRVLLNYSYSDEARTYQRITDNLFKDVSSRAVETETSATRCDDKDLAAPS